MRFVDPVVPNVLRDLEFSGNRPLKEAEDRHSRILKNKLIKIWDVVHEIKKKTRLDVVL
jgi:hypothetical protein